MFIPGSISVLGNRTGIHSIVLSPSVLFGIQTTGITPGKKAISANPKTVMVIDRHTDGGDYVKEMNCLCCGLWCFDIDTVG